MISLTLPISESRNLILRRLSKEARARVDGEATERSLAFKQVLVDQGQTSEELYFVETVVISLVVDLENGETVETGTIGNEGFLGLARVLGGHSPNRAIVQIPGRALVPGGLARWGPGGWRGRRCRPGTVFAFHLPGPGISVVGTRAPVGGV